MEIPKYVVKPNSAILERAKKIFGDDLVTDAFLGAPQYSFMDDNYARNEITMREAQFHLNEIDSQLDVDAVEIFIKLSNGRMLHFFSSEWATISLIDEENVIQVLI